MAEQEDVDPSGTGMTRSCGTTPGFTLIELVVTVTIIGIIVSVALPAMRNLSIGDSAGELEPLRALLVDARQRAAVGGKRVEVWIVPASGRYRMQSDARGGAHVRDGVLRLRNVRTRGPSDRFRVVFDPVGLGVGDTMAAAGVLLWVDANTGSIVIER